MTSARGRLCAWGTQTGIFTMPAESLGNSLFASGGKSVRIWSPTPPKASFPFCSAIFRSRFRTVKFGCKNIPHLDYGLCTVNSLIFC